MIFPPEFKILFRQPEVRGAFVSGITTNHPGDCLNCGGVGKVFVFLATVGPVNNPPVGVAVHFAGGKWWGGSTKGGICPACKGSGQDASYGEKPYVVPEEWVGARIRGLAEAKG